MNIGEAIKQIFHRKIFILLIGVIFALLLFIYAKLSPAEYTARATVFPLTSQADNEITANTLSNILGISDAPKSFSSEASINIIELALSRNVRERVASSRIPQFGNKTVTELLVQEKNAHKSLFSQTIELPSDSMAQAALGSTLLNPDINAKINKNGVLELYYTSTNSSFVQPVSEILISKISEFYIDLRIEKALSDYSFTLKKIDSIESILNNLDSKAIQFQGSTYFTPEGKLLYDLPKENLSLEKQRAVSEENGSISDREEALWRLQKVTPIIATLDKPEPPYDVKKSSSILYAIIGFMIGIIFATFFVARGVIYRYIKSELYKLMETDNDTSTQTTTTDRL